MKVMGMLIHWMKGICVDDEDAPATNYSVEFIISETGNKSYILTVSERTPLINGFIYISKNI